MKLHPEACEWYKLVIATEPPTEPTDWEASFDNDETWHPAQNIDNASAWLVAGADYEGAATPVFVLTKRTTPWLRLIDSPETVIRRSSSHLEILI